MNTFRNYADYEIPLLQVLGDLLGTTSVPNGWRKCVR